MGPVNLILLLGESARQLAVLLALAAANAYAITGNVEVIRKPNIQ
jgi:hypothetical protein